MKFENTWKVGDSIHGVNISYTVGITTINSMVVRCLFLPEENMPCAVIWHIIGHNDWVFFSDTCEENHRLGVPQILNSINEGKVFIDAEKSARKIMNQIQNSF